MGGHSTDFLNGGGKMGALMRAHDWLTSPLGVPAQWPDTLKSAVATCLNSRFPMVVWWGPQLIMLYNDAWQPILGETKHPHGLGRPGADSWPDTWPIVGQQFESALKGVASWSEDLLLASDRHGYMQECYFTYSHSPLIDATGKIVGVLTAVVETTARILTERRMRVLGALSKATIEATTGDVTIEETCQNLLDLLCSDNPDIPFAVQFIADESGHARLVAASQIDRALFPSSLSALSPDDVWGIVNVLKTRALRIIERSPEPRFALPGGSWPEPTTQLVALPLLRKSPGNNLVGALLIGANSRLHLDSEYLDFLMLVAAELAGSISALRSIETEQRSARAKELLVRELQHRSRNLLAVVRSISERTRATSTSLDDYAGDFNGRLGALSRVQGLLSREESEAIGLDELVHMEMNSLGVTDSSDVSIGGPNLALPRDSVQMLSLALHELGTNSIKHGVLNGSGGTLEIRWKLASTDKPALRLEWSERRRKLAELVVSHRHGFGRTLLEQALPGQLGATTRFDLRPDGLQCVIELPVESAT
ncbi:PAS domain-containing sensor histidine kinase [Bradyrhizobium sp. Ec3.3]|uniref:PAS domain-containing sensor histidine kinase n=1 Tax=Bradyrhizobium sp. Ec3.3 TaxID=189753 RepID=UPI00042755DD|nr:HWE histidine kinase domain-containing protein [Bradyrhizobium sp. Ec3.3]